MSSCLECFFYSGLSGKYLQIAIDEEHPNFVCEHQRCSPYSPGPVNDDEEIGFLLIDPSSYDEETGVVTPDAFRELTNRDLSVLRLNVASRAEAEELRQSLIKRGRERIPPQLRLISEVCVTSAKNIRDALIQNERVFAIYDTALPFQPSHASIFGIKSIHLARLARKRARARCFEIFSQTIKPFNDVVAELKAI